MVRTVLSSLAVASALSVTALAQWPLHLTPDVPRLPDGKPNLDAPAPRRADGKPDLSGTWESRVPPSGRLGGPALPSLTPDAPPLATFVDISRNMQEPLPMTPWAADLKKRRMARNSMDNPDAHCLPMGFMQLHTHSQPRKYIQTDHLLVLLYEANYGQRTIYLDGRPAPDNDPQPWWYGYSRGRWDGDTLIVETTNYRDGGWLDVNGSPFTDALKSTERFRRVNYGRLEIDVTIDDAKAYTRPFTVRVNHRLIPGDELIEFICLENEQSSKHLVAPEDAR